MFGRNIKLERANVDEKNGTFDAVVFTDGEASDNHRLDIRGGEVPDTLPLFVNHDPDPRTQLGTLHRLRTDEHEVVMRGEIFLEGTGAEADIRRDIFAKVAAGHLSSMSGRWDQEAMPTMRSELSKDHWAHGSQGLYFDSWRAMEGSIVGLGADPAAVMRFATDAETPELQAFWRSLLPEKEEPAPVDLVELWRDSTRQLIERGYDPETLYCVFEEVRDDLRPRPIDLAETPSTEDAGTSLDPIDAYREGYEEMMNGLEADAESYISWRKGVLITDASRVEAAMRIHEALKERARRRI